MQNPEETFFAERIAANIVPLYRARHNRKWDSARSALQAIPGANVNDVDLCKNFDQIAVANPETLAVGSPFCMTMKEDAVKSRSLEEKMRIHDLSELIAESTTAPTK
jgi:Fe-S oxidoreductase